MKRYFYLTKKYITSYPKRYLSIILCMSLFIFACLTILWYYDSFNYSLTENDRIKNGSYAMVDFGANKELVFQNKDEIAKEEAGILQGIWKVDNTEADIWIGEADKNVNTLLAFQFISGKMPESANEIAIEKSTYKKLNLNHKVGDTVELTVQNTDGSTEKKKFILSGIIANYSSKLRAFSVSSTTPKVFSIPSILTVNQNVEPSYVHVFAKQLSGVILDLDSEYTAYKSTFKKYAPASDVSNLILVLMTSFFTAGTVVGILSVSACFFKEQEQYLNLLRCIGFSKKKSKKLLFIQGLLLWIGSLLFAILESVILLYLLQYLSSFSSQPLLIKLNPIILIVVSSFAGIIIFVSFHILLARFYKNTPLRENIYSPKRPRKSQTNIKHCWQKAYGRKYRLQNMSCIILIFLCVGMSIFGSFCPVYMAQVTTFFNPDGFPENADYSLYVSSGSSSEESYYINFPIHSGISRDVTNEIISDDRIKVLEASVTHLCIPFFLTTQTPENKLLYKYVVEAEQNGYRFLFNHNRSKEMIEIAGGDSNKESLVELPVKWQSYDSVLNSINTFTNGEINEKSYKSGIEIIAPDDLCTVGDEFTMIIPVPDENATEENINEHIAFKPTKLRVAATYSREKYNSDRLIISIEYLFSVYPDLDYEEILIQNLAHNDLEWKEELEESLEDLGISSSNVIYNNYAEMSDEFYGKINLQLFQTIVSITIFIIIIMTAIVFLTYIQIRSNLRSYVIMRAIGAKVKTIQKLITDEIKHIITLGMIIGAVIAWVLIFLVSVMDNQYYWNIYLFYVVPVFSITIALLYTCSYFASKKAVQSIIDQNIIEKLNTVE